MPSAEAHELAAPSAVAREPLLLLVLFCDGDLGLWQLPQELPWAVPAPVWSREAQRLPAGMRALAVGFSPSGLPLVASEGGCVHVLHATLARATARIDPQSCTYVKA